MTNYAYVLRAQIDLEPKAKHVRRITVAAWCGS